MLESYDDIRSRINEEPKWFDCNGVPRYCEPEPTSSPNIYADEVLFYEIACQECGAKFVVEENWSRLTLDSIMGKRGHSPLSDRVRSKHIHYGDPPCWTCAAGATMNCEDLRTLQFWTRVGKLREWVRVPELEGISLSDEE